jgi:predicted nucleic acid-binding protein
MVVVTDANILISASLNLNGKIANLIFSNSSKINFVTPAFIQYEIKENEAKICSQNRISKAEFNQNIILLLTKILLIKDDEISEEIFKDAFGLTKHIDPADTIYTALAISLDALLWTGDLKLLRGLKKKGFRHIITTSDLEQIVKGL